MAKRSMRDMLKARAWNSQVSLADVDPGDHLGVKRKKIAAAGDKYGPELLELQERLFAEKKQAILIVLQGLDTSGKDGTVRHVMAAKVTPRAAIPKRPRPIAMSLSDWLISAAFRSFLKMAR